MAFSFPLAFAAGKSVAAVAVGAIFFLGCSGKEGLVRRGINLFSGVAAQTEWINHGQSINFVRRRAVSARSPGFVGDVVIGLAVTIYAANIGAGMRNCQNLLDIVGVTNMATTVIGP
ncbi:MAG: hypothetical protein M1608_01270 [Candidatus Omnitrophica bacterium]|nr:hypothetical protein [Candidatus Omnitrophota bacterium]